MNVFYNASWCLFSYDINGSSDDDCNMMDNDDEEEDQEKGNNSGMEDEGEDSNKKLSKMERRKYTPYRFSGKSYSFDTNQEKQIIDNMRSWTQQYFSTNTVIHSGMYTLLKDVRQEQAEGKEFDLLCKILKIFAKDEHSYELRIKD